MSSVSPAAVLFDVNGVALAVYNNTAVPASTPALLFAGYDGYNAVSRYAFMGAQGNLGVSEVSNNVVVLSNATVTANGQDIFVSQFFGAQEINLIVNSTVTPTGTTPNLTFTIQEVDPGNGTTVFGNSSSTTTITTGNSPGVFTASLVITTSSAVRVSWTISGAGATYTGVYATITTKSTPSTQTINGTVTTTNNSVGSDGAPALAFDTQVGGKTTTAAPTYVNGNLDALSLTTLGGLRIDGVYATGTANATAADVMNSGGYVTTAAPTYTTGQLEPLSIDTAGNLRTSVNNTVTVTGAAASTFNNQSVGADAAAALGFDTQVGGKTTTAAPTYTTGNLDALSLTTLGGLRIDGVYAVGTANATAADVMNSGGYVTTAAPTYTTGQLSPLSLDTFGNLRVSAITNKAATSAVTSVASSTSNTVVLAANTSRVFAAVYNGANKTMFLKLGTTASTSSYTIQIFSGSYWEVPNDYQGEIDAVWGSGTSGNVLVTELTP